jgi:hypothetical protein
VGLAMADDTDSVLLQNNALTKIQQCLQNYRY